MKGNDESADRESHSGKGNYKNQPRGILEFKSLTKMKSFPDGLNGSFEIAEK